MLSLPAIQLDYTVDAEYVFTAVCRTTGSILAAASSYDCAAATLRIDFQLIEQGYEVYEPDNIFDLN